VDAIIRNLEIVGDAAKKVPDDIKSMYPQVEWKRMGGLRHILIHEYFGVDAHIIWDIVKNKLTGIVAKAVAEWPKFARLAEVDA